MDTVAPIHIFDTTLRDGEQSPGVSLGTAAKLEIARCLVRLRVDVIEAGFPVTSTGEDEAVRAVAREVRGGPVVAALARTHRKDIDAAWDAVRMAERPRLHVFISTSDIHLKHMLGLTRDGALEMLGEAVRYASSLSDSVQFSAQDATRSDVSFLARAARAAIEAGARIINIPDTVGYTMPGEYQKLFRTLREMVPELDGVELSAHTHDDLGLAVANALAAVEGGATQIECTVNGIGERAGNCALEEVVMGLATREDFHGTRTGVDTRHLYRTSRLVADLTGVPVQPNKAVVGANAFAHEAGIHQDGVLKEPSTYEIMRPEDVGMGGSRLVLGKHSGRHAFRNRLLELGYDPGQEELEAAFARFKELADEKAHVLDEELEAIVNVQLAAAPEVCRLDYFLVTSGNQAIATATVRLEITGDAREYSACGSGPVDAVFRAIDGAAGVELHLADYNLRAVTGGADALGEVTLRLEEGGEAFRGRGLSSDVVEASAHAYVGAVNRYLKARGVAVPVSGAGGEGV